MKYPAPIPDKLVILLKSKQLKVQYTEQSFTLPASLLRFFSPAADNARNRNKANFDNISLRGCQLAGNYAVKIMFSDGHFAGIYSWHYLYDLCQNKTEKQQQYKAYYSKRSV